MRGGNVEMWCGPPSAVGLSGHASRLICSGHFPASLPPMILALQLVSFESHRLIGAPSREKSLAPLTAAGQRREKTARRPRRSACPPLLATGQGNLGRCHLIRDDQGQTKDDQVKMKVADRLACVWRKAVLLNLQSLRCESSPAGSAQFTALGGIRNH